MHPEGSNVISSLSQKQKIKSLLQPDNTKTVYQSEIHSKPKKDSMTTQNSSMNEKDGSINRLLDESISFQRKIKIIDEVLK